MTRGDAKAPGGGLLPHWREVMRIAWPLIKVEYMLPYLLMFVAVFTVFDCFNLVFSFALKGAGDTRFVTLVALCLPWPLMVLPTWYVSDLKGGLYWAWGAASVFIITQALVFWRSFVGGKWMEMRVIESGP